MKTLLKGIAVGALIALVPNAQAVKPESILEGAQAYLDNTHDEFGQGFFMGSMIAYIENTNNCVPDGMKYSDILPKIAKIVIYDSAILKLKNTSQIVVYSVHKAYPCTKS
nr:MAG TPA: RAP1A, SSSP1, PROTEIN RAP1A COMPLEX.0A [Bacteriophage sp.]